MLFSVLAVCSFVFGVCFNCFDILDVKLASAQSSAECVWHKKSVGDSEKINRNEGLQEPSQNTQQERNHREQHRSNADGFGRKKMFTLVRDGMPILANAELDVALAHSHRCWCLGVIASLGKSSKVLGNLWQRRRVGSRV